MPDDPAAARAAKSVRPDVDRKARLRIPAQLPPKQPSGQRVGNWDEVYALFDPDFAAIEAERCIQCPAAPCQKACPVGNDIPAALWLLEKGDIDGAADIFRDTSELPEMCGRLCPQERLCEGHCVVGKNAAPVAIGKLETFITERQRTHGTPPAPKREAASGKSVAIVGSGPAGIACGERLARRGHRVVIYDAWPEPGGVLLYGIPNFKQNKPAVERKFRELAALGVEVVAGTHIGSDIPFEQLASDFDAVFLAAGAPIGARLGMEHEDAPGVFEATEFLVRANLLNWRPTCVFESYAPTDGFRQPFTGGGLVFVFGGSSSATNGASVSVSGLVATIQGSATASSNAGLHTGFGTWGSVGFTVVCAPDRSPFARVRFNPTGTGSASVVSRVYGFVSAVTVGSLATASGAYLRRNTTGNLFSVTRQGGSETTTDLGVQSNAQRWYDIWTPDAGATWYFYDYTGALQATHTTNLPTPTTDLGFAAMLEQSAGYQSHQVSAIWVDIVDE